MGRGERGKQVASGQQFQVTPNNGQVSALPTIVGRASTECIVFRRDWNGLLPVVTIGEEVSSWESSATEAEKVVWWQDDEP